MRPSRGALSETSLIAQHVTDEGHSRLLVRSDSSTYAHQDEAGESVESNASIRGESAEVGDGLIRLGL
jgi:hypothetical protein